jgi:hypothetical protein
MKNSRTRLEDLPLAAQKKIVALASAESAQTACPMASKLAKRPVKSDEIAKFCCWFQIVRHLEDAAIFADYVAKELSRRPALDRDKESIALGAQIAFEQRAVQTDNADLFVKLRRLRQNEPPPAGPPLLLAMGKGKSRRRRPSENRQKAELRKIVGVVSK